MIGSSAIIDANVAIKMVLTDPLQERCRDLMARLVAGGHEVVAPALWAYEITSTLSKAVHLGQLTPVEGREALARIAALGIRLIPPDEAQNQRAFDWTLRLKRSTAYDSYYLALAETLECDLWTADRRLLNAADLPWVRWVGG